jgi:ribonuclease P/MRP protein subunit RPP1
LAANNSVDHVRPIRTKRYFDYVSADLIEDICSDAAESMDSETDSSLAVHIGSFFKKFGFTDIIFFKKPGQRDSDFDGVYRSLMKSDGPVRCHNCVEIEAGSENELYSLIRKERPNADFIAVRSSDEKIIRAAAESFETDLIIPVSYAEKRSQNSGSTLHVSAGQINHIAAKIARDKKTAFAFDLYPFLQTKGYRRSKLFSDCMEMIPILRKYGVPVLPVSGAVSYYEARGPYECEAFGTLLGLSKEEAVRGVSDVPAEIFERRKKQKSGQIISSGVEMISNERQD